MIYTLSIHVSYHLHLEIAASTIGRVSHLIEGKWERYTHTNVPRILFASSRLFSTEESILDIFPNMKLHFEL